MELGDILVMVLPVLVTLVFTYVKLAGKISNITKEIGEFLVSIGGALADGKLSKEEIELIMKEAKDIKEAITAIKTKEVQK